MCVFFSPSVLFWFGDLNFRIEDYDIHVVKCAIDSNKLPLLWERDQVRDLHRFQKKINSVFNMTSVCHFNTKYDQQRTLQHKYDRPPPPLLHSSTWLKAQSPSWRASTRDHSNSRLRISSMWAPIRMTPGSSAVLRLHLPVAHFRLTFCNSLYPICSSSAPALRRGNLPGRIASCGAFVVQAPLYLPTMQRCSEVSPHGWAVPLRSHSMCTEVTWATPSVTTSPFLPCFRCM